MDKRITSFGVTTILVLLVYISINCGEHEENSSFDTVKLESKNDLLFRRRAMRLTDRIWNNYEQGKLVDKDSIIWSKVKSYEYGIESTFQILRDSAGEIMKITQLSNAMPGEDYIETSTYFDAKGRTFAFKKDAGYYGSECTDGMAYESQTTYFDTAFNRIDSTIKLVDEIGQQLDIRKCKLRYQYIFPIERSAADYFNTLKLSDQVK